MNHNSLIFWVFSLCLFFFFPIEAVVYFKSNYRKWAYLKEQNKTKQIKQKPQVNRYILCKIFLLLFTLQEHLMGCSVEIVSTLCRQSCAGHSLEACHFSKKMRTFCSTLGAPCTAEHSHRWAFFTFTPPKEDTGSLFNHINYFCLKVIGPKKHFWKFLKSQAELWLAGA